ncbi:MAG: 4-(cytidine 5'-diphospho)-2-C-methyl-D-erythritol kinase [Clostridia bacterium]|nr:4-(cytidine 5'-diphospho)-2-C-methyl-D-erythritol kinase [Clostridia bacterium]
MNKQITLKARAKINLALDAIKKREDGYHEVKMIMQEIDLFDEVSVQEDSGSEIKVNSNLDYLPNDDSNIAYKAAELLLKTYNIKKGVSIDIHKNIPVSAGLAGGSTDAAAVLIGLNQLWDMHLSKNDLMKLGGKLGADVPFCILGGCAVAEGIGDELRPIAGLDAFVVLCKPNLRVSTAKVYSNLKLDEIEKHPDVDEMVQQLKTNKIEEIKCNMINVLETVTLMENPIVSGIKLKLLECRAEAALMSGSGPTVFGLYKDYNRAKSAFENLKKVYNETYLVKTVK